MIYLGIYGKIENKWFNFLDWLDNKGIPIYKVIDPIEKAGIPSLPLFTAIAIILIYFFVLGGGLPGFDGGGRTVSFSVQITDGTLSLAEASVSIYESDNSVCGGTTGPSGLISCELEEGSYRIMVEKQDCSFYNSTINVYEGLETKAIPLLGCGDAGGEELELCFNPQGVGIVDLIIYEENGDYYDTITNCGTDECTYEFADDYLYHFETSADYASTQNYSRYTLQLRVSNGFCVDLEKGGYVGPTGEVSVLLLDQGNNSIQDATILAVDPIDSETEVDSQITDINGIVYLEGPLDSEFRIKVPASNITPYYIGSVAYMFEEDTYNVTVVLDTTNVSNVQSVIETVERIGAGERALSGVYVKVRRKANEELIASGYTENGETVFTLTDGEIYRVTATMSGYNYTEIELTGGLDTKIIMEAMPPEQLGDVFSTIIFKDFGEERVDDASVTLANTDGKDIGYPAQITNALGKATFVGIPAGDFCINIVRTSVGDKIICAELEEGGSTITLEGGKKTYPAIYIDAHKFMLSVFVKLADNTEVKEAVVSTVDKLGNVESADTSAIGLAAIEVYERSDIELHVIHEDMKASKILNPLTNDTEETIVLDIVDTSVNFIEITEGTNNLEAGSTYHFSFNLGLPDINDEKWDTVIFEIKTLSDNLELLEVDLNWLTVDISQDKKQETITIGANYPISDSILNIELPVRVKGNVDKEQDVVLEYRAVWEKDGDVIVDPQTGYKETTKFNIQKGEYGVSKPNGDFTILKYLIVDGVEISASNTIIPLGDQITAVYEITRVAAEDFSGDMDIKEIDPATNLRFASFDIKSYTQSGNQKDEFLFGNGITQNDLTVYNDITITNVELSEGETLKAMITLDVVAGYAHRGQLVASAGTENLGNIVFDISGNMPTYIAAPLEISDLDSSLTFNVTSPAIVGNIDMGSIGTVTINGDGFSEELVFNPSLWGGYDPLIVGIDQTTNEFTIIFNNQYYPLTSGTVDISITGSGNGLYSIEQTSVSIEVKGCIEIPGQQGGKISIAPGQTCKIEINPEKGIRSAYVYAYAEYCQETDPAIVNIKIADNCGATRSSFSIQGQAVLDNGATNDEFINQVITSSMSITIENDFEFSEALNLIDNVHYTLEVDYQGRTKTYDLTSGFIIWERNVIEQGNVFNPFGITVQKYSDTPYNCRGNFDERYCNIEQAMEYIRAHTNNFGTAKNVEFNLVFQTVAPQDIQTLLLDMSELSDKTILISKPEDLGTLSGANDYLIISSSTGDMPRADNNIAHLETKTKDGVTYKYLRFTNSYDTEILEVFGLLARMPGQITQLNAPDRFVSTIDVSQLPLTWQASASGSLEEIFRTMWGVSDYSSVSHDNANRFIKAEYCNKANREETRVICNQLESMTGDILTPAIYVTAAGGASTVHIVTNTNEDMISLINALKAHTGDPNVVSLYYKRTSMNENDADFEPSDPLGGYITLAPTDFYYKCIDQNNECDSIIGDLDFENNVTKLAAKTFARAEQDVTVIPFSEELDEDNVYLVIYANDALPVCDSSNSGDEKCIHKQNFDEMWGREMDIPETGIMWDVWSTGIGHFTPRYYLFTPDASNAGELIEEFVK